MTSHDHLTHVERQPVPPHSDQLAQRITAMAARTTQRVSLWQWLRYVCEEFHLPRPAYSAALMIVIGLTLGFMVPLESAPYAPQAASYDMYSYYDGGLHD